MAPGLEASRTKGPRVQKASWASPPNQPHNQPTNLEQPFGKAWNESTKSTKPKETKPQTKPKQTEAKETEAKSTNRPGLWRSRWLDHVLLHWPWDPTARAPVQSPKGSEERRALFALMNVWEGYMREIKICVFFDLEGGEISRFLRWGWGMMRSFCWSLPPLGVSFGALSSLPALPVCSWEDGHPQEGRRCVLRMLVEVPFWQRFGLFIEEIPGFFQGFLGFLYGFPGVSGWVFKDWSGSEWKLAIELTLFQPGGGQLDWLTVLGLNVPFFLGVWVFLVQKEPVRGCFFNPFVG